MLSVALCPDSDLLAKRSAGIYTQCASEAHHHFAAIPQDFNCLLSAAFLRSYACLSPHIRSTFASVLRGLLCHVSIWYFSELVPKLAHLVSQIPVPFTQPYASYSWQHRPFLNALLSLQAFPVALCLSLHGMFPSLSKLPLRRIWADKNKKKTYWDMSWESALPSRSRSASAAGERWPA